MIHDCNCSPCPPNSFSQIHFIKNPQPDWLQTDPKQSNFIKNKEIAEFVRAIKVNGIEYLGVKRETGALNLIGGTNITLTPTPEGIIISSLSTGDSGLNGIVAGTGIIFTLNEQKQTVISIDEELIKDNASLIALIKAEENRAKEAEQSITTTIGSLATVVNNQGKILDLLTGNGEGSIEDLVVKTISSLGIATAEQPGLVKTSSEITTDENGSLKINAVSTDKIIQGDNELLLYCGSSQI